nr:hypothetical protein [Bradyrhizobium sp. 168]
MQPAIRHAASGFAASEYLCMSANIVAADLQGFGGDLGNLST